MPASVSRSGPSAASRARAWSSVRGGRVAFGLPEGGGGLAGAEDGGSAIAAGAQDAGGVGMAECRRRRYCGAPGASRPVGRGGRRRGPGKPVRSAISSQSAVDLGEVLPAVMGAAGGVDGDVQVRAAGSVLTHVWPSRRRVPATAGRLAWRPRRPAPSPGRPARPRARAKPAGPAKARAGRAGRSSAARAAWKPAWGGVRREFVDIRPRTLGVDVVRGQRGRRRPQSSMPARRIRSYCAPTRLGGAWMRALEPRMSLVHGDRPRPGRRVRRRGASRILVSGLARKFCTMTSWMPAVLTGDLADGEGPTRARAPGPGSRRCRSGCRLVNGTFAAAGVLTGRAGARPGPCPGCRSAGRPCR